MNRVAEVTLEGAVKEDKPSSQIGRTQCCCCAVSSEPSSAHVENCTKEELREDSPVLSCPGARSVETEGRHSKDCMTRSLRGEKVLARPISSEPLNRMNSRQVRIESENNSAECSVETAEGVFTAREVRHYWKKTKVTRERWQ